MKRKHILTPLASLLFLWGCDTTEEMFYPGSSSEINLDVTQTGVIKLSADGAPMTLDVKSSASWEASIEQEANNFKVVQSANKGNGTITVSGTLNVNDTEREAKLVLTTQNFDKQVKMDIRQAALKFKMSHDIPEIILGTGGTYNITIDSSIGWNLDVIQSTGEDKDISWLEVTPGMSGEGAWNDQEVTVNIPPNYTKKDRSVTLALRPQDQKALESLGASKLLPKEFTILQTTPDNWVTTLKGEPMEATITYNSCEIKIEYASLAPVTEVGILLKEPGGEEKKFKASPETNEYSMKGTLRINLTDLKPGTYYTVTPYVVCDAGTVEGEDANFYTKDASDVIKDISVSFTNPSYKECEVKISYTSLMDITDVGVYLKTQDGEDLGTFHGEKVNGAYPKSGDVKLTLTGLNTNTRYSLTPFATCAAGTQTGNPMTFDTKREEGVKIRNWHINPASRSVSVNVDVVSDCALTEGELTIYDEFDKKIDSFICAVEADATTLTLSTPECLQPKTQYKVMIRVRTAVNESSVGPDYFTTKGLTPDKDDNHPIE